MKKIGLICSVALTGMNLVACGNQSTSKEASSSSKTSSSKVVKHHKNKKQNKQHSVSNSSASATFSNAQTNGQQTATAKSQGEINRERSYDPTGAPLLPGQDHAAGANPDGTPDAWVQGQIDWAKQNGYLNPDGSETYKGRAADQWVEENAQ